MPKPSPEQQRIADLQHALEVAMYWLLRAHLQGIGHSRLCSEAIGVENFLANHGVTVNHGVTGATAKALLKRPMEAYHFELEKAVKRATE